MQIFDISCVSNNDNSYRSYLKFVVLFQSDISNSEKNNSTTASIDKNSAILSPSSHTTFSLRFSLLPSTSHNSVILPVNVHDTTVNKTNSHRQDDFSQNTLGQL